MLIIDPDGRIARVMAAPRPSDVVFLVGGPFGTPGFDAKGRLIYRASARDWTAPRPAGTWGPPPERDSAPIVRLNLRTRKLDTAAVFRIRSNPITRTQTKGGQLTTLFTLNPLPLYDDWAILPDGSIAVIRGNDFHIDWIRSDGHRESSGKIPFEWRRLGDDQKVAFMDSVRTSVEKQRAKTRALLAVRTPPGTEAPQLSELAYIASAELPDYVPAVETGSTRADLDGTLWIRTSQIIDGRPVYYLVNRSGKLVDRLQLPGGRVIAGFGSNHTIFLGFVDTSGVRLERARIN